MFPSRCPEAGFDRVEVKMTFHPKDGIACIAYLMLE